MTSKGQELKIGVVGPCAAGKTTLIDGINKHGFEIKHIAQEHSYVPDMWDKITKPDVLIFLDVTYEVSMKRKPMNWTENEFLEQVNRLNHARQYADLFINTDGLTIKEVLEITIRYLKEIV